MMMMMMMHYAYGCFHLDQSLKAKPFLHVPSCLTHSSRLSFQQMFHVLMLNWCDVRSLSVADGLMKNNQIWFVFDLSNRGPRFSTVKLQSGETVWEKHSWAAQPWLQISTIRTVIELDVHWEPTYFKHELIFVLVFKMCFFVTVCLKCFF